MTAPSVSNRLENKETDIQKKVNVNFDDVVNYLGQRNNGSAPWDNVVTYSPWVDVRAYNSINEAVTAIGSTQTTLLIPNAQTLTANLTIPSTLTLVISKGGSIVKASTFTLTINGPVIAQDYQIFSGFSAGNIGDCLQYAYPDWFGTGTTAWQSAIQSLQSGGTLKLAGKTYTITANVNINVNRITFDGVSPDLTVLNYTPAADGTSMFSTDGTRDNMTFQNFTINHTNRSTYHNTQAFNIASGDTKHTWTRVFFTGIGRYGIHFGSGTYYMLIEKCRFIRINDSTATVTPIAVFSEGTNVFDLHDCYFSENDKDIQISGGTCVQVFNNNFEVGGNSGNVNVDVFVHFASINNLWFTNNYIEANDTNGGSFLFLNNCKCPIVEDNYFNGQEGSTDKTDTFIRVNGSSSRNVLIKSNNFVEVVTYFINNTVPVKLVDNYYFDGGVEKTTYAAISPYIADTTQLDIDIMGNYAATSTITGWTTPTAKIWFEKMDDIVHVEFEITGTSNATTVSFTLPFTSAGNWAVNATGLGHDNGADLTDPIYISLATSSAICNVFKTFSAGAWTNANAKKVYGQFFYQAA